MARVRAHLIVNLTPNYDPDPELVKRPMMIRA